MRLLVLLTTVSLVCLGGFLGAGLANATTTTPAAASHAQAISPQNKSESLAASRLFKFKLLQSPGSASTPLALLKVSALAADTAAFKPIQQMLGGMKSTLRFAATQVPQPSSGLTTRTTSSSRQASHSHGQPSQSPPPPPQAAKTTIQSLFPAVSWPSHSVSVSMSKLWQATDDGTAKSSDLSLGGLILSISVLLLLY